jgi:alkylation response protein AidB-like acyl-CoA dehydrogenase
VLQAAESVGAADVLFASTVEYLKQRVQFGRTIASFQAIKHRLADMLMALEGMRAAAHYAALALGDGLPDAAEAVATAGAYVDDTFAHLSGEALQLHGGIGFTWEHDVHLFVRRAKVNQVLYGDGAWHCERLVRLVEAGARTGEA